MKTSLIFSFCLLSASAFTQLTYVPDDALEDFLETNYPACSDGVTNDYVLTSGLSSVVQITIMSDNYPVLDFTGLEDCNNLVGIEVSNSSYCTSLDFSMVNTASTTYGAINLNIGFCPNLVSLKAPKTTITFVVENCNLLNNIELYPTTSLVSVAVSFCNNLEVLDLSMVSSVQPSVFFIPQIVVSLNPLLSCVNLKNGYCHVWNAASFYGNNLTCIEVDDPSYCANSTNWSDETLLAGGTGTYSSSCGNCTTGLEQTKLDEKEVVRITDLLGRVTLPKPNMPLIYIYSDGSMERVFVTD